MSSGGEDQNNNTTLLQGSRLLYITQDGNQSVGINSYLDPSTNAVMGLVIFNELNDPPNQTRISINNEGITETFANGDPSINVSWENFYLLKQATPALRIPDASNIFVVSDTYEANDNNLAKTRKATLSAVASADTKLELEILTSGEKATLTQDTLTYLDISGGTAVSASWASIIAGNPTPSLSSVLAVGNSAGTFDIDMSGNDILNCASITSTGDLLLNPVGSIDANGKTLNMTAGEIHNCPLIHSQNNIDITIEGKGNADVILKTANTNRLAISDTGDWTINGGVGTSGQVLTSAGAGVSPSWTTISAPNPTLIQTEDMLYYPQLILNSAYPTLAGIMGTEIPLAVYNYNGGTTETWNGGYNANLLSGSLQRLGCSLLYSGVGGYTQHTSINEYSFTQISKITWGFCCLGNNYPDGLPTLTTDATYVMGLAPTADRASSLFAVNTTNSIFWCWNGSSYAPPITTKFSFIINGVSQYTLTTNTNMTGKWGRCGFTINYVSGNTAQVQGFFTDLSTGITETTGVYTITGGTGFVNPITSPNACSVYHSVYGNGQRWFLVDYVQVETPNLYQIGVGSTQTAGR